MKVSKIKKIFIRFFVFVFCFVMTGCGVNVNNNMSDSIEDDNYTYSSVKGDTGYGFRITAGSITIAETKTPITIIIKKDSDTGNYDYSEYTSSYSEFTKTGKSLVFKGTIATSGGSEFLITDEYIIDGDVKINREVTVTKEGEDDAGYESRYQIDYIGSNTGNIYTDFEFFVPGMLYKDTQYMSESAKFGDMSLSENYARETRSSLPMVFLRNIKDNYSLVLFHYTDGISSGVGNAVNKISDTFNYGSIGYKFTDTCGISYTYPAREGNSKTDVEKWVNVYNNIILGEKQEYSLSVMLSNESTFMDSMSDAYTRAYAKVNPLVKDDIDILSLYEDTITIFKDKYTEYGTDKTSCGLNFEYYLPDASAGGESFQMGFVGQQCYVAAELIRYGYENNDSDALKKGENIIEFWVRIIEDYSIPVVWWLARNDDNSGKPFVDGSEVYPSFIRCIVDGMNGIIEAYNVAKNNGVDHANWYNGLIKVADKMVDVQCSDGSFSRAYDPFSGKTSQNESKEKYQCSSKMNTPVMIDYLYNMYNLTGNEDYKESALFAAEYSYNEIYLKLNKFVGGTPDNANVVDKEAAVYAMIAFLDSYELSENKEEKENYLKAAEYSSLLAMSWVYVYDFKVVDGKNENFNPFKNGGTIGFSLIATGHSGADCYMSFCYYYYYRLYKITGSDLYLDMARLLQYNTKSVTDYDGRLGYKYKSMSVEATDISNFYFSSANGGVWLPWIGIAYIHGIYQLESEYGISVIN